MSRVATAGQLTTPLQNIFITEITQPDGKKKLVKSSQPLSDSSIRINAPGNSGAASLLIGLYLQNNSIVDNNPLARLINKIIRYRKMVPDVWGKILTFSFGEQSESLGRYVVAIRRPTLFPQITTNQSDIVDAAIRGEEDIVMNELIADPLSLLKTATVTNSVGVKYEVTALQAAIMATDVQMAEKMKAHFARLTTDLSGNAIDGLAEMQSQIKAIYINSLQNYCDIQKAVLKKLETKQVQLLELSPHLLKAQERQYDEIQEKIKQVAREIRTFTSTLQCDDIQKIIEAHNQAQEHNAFDFQPYVNAILSAPDAELDVVMELINATTPEETAAVVARYLVAEKPSDAARLKSFDELTLVEKLNRFREELVKHMQQEIIFNPNHILAGLKSNDTAWDTLTTATDPGYKKRSIIFSQLAGWAQRNADEAVRQDMRQGTYYLTEKNEPRSRQSRFNEYRNSDIVQNSLVDVSLVGSLVVGGLGYKFASDVWRGGLAGCGARARGARRVFTKLMSSKNSKLSELVTRSVRACAHKPERRCSMM